MPRSPSPALNRWLAAYVAQAGTPERAQQFVDAVDSAILAEVTEVRADPSLTEDLHQSTAAHWQAFLGWLVRPDQEPALPAQAAALAHSLARRGQDLAVLLKIYRRAHQAVWSEFSGLVTVLTEDDPPRDEVLVLLFGHATEWLDSTTEQLIEAYYAERDMLQEGVTARHRETVEALLSGEETDPARASESLGHAVSRYQTCLVLSVAKAEPDSLRIMRSTALRIARSAGAPRPLVLAAGSRELWCWMAHPSRRAAREGVASLTVPRSLRGALGTPAAGVPGFRSTFEEARAVQRLVSGQVETTGLLRYAELDLLCLVGGRSSAVERMVRRELRALGGPGANMAVVRETVLVHLRVRQNVDAAALILSVHPNTVRYRLGRAEHFLGRPLNERIAHLELALRYVEMYGPVVDAMGTARTS